VSDLPPASHSALGEVISSDAMRHRLIVLLLLAGAGLGVLFYPWVSVLEISSISTGHVLWCSSMEVGEEFVLSFTHSVNKRPVFDTLQAQGDHLVIVKSVFDAFGAGMPDASTEDGQFSVLPGGWLQWRVNRPVPEIVLRVGQVANHTVTIKTRQFLLAELTEPGTAVAFRVRMVSFLATMKGRCRQ
jgi:hypothetical protein